MDDSPPEPRAENDPLADSLAGAPLPDLTESMVLLTAAQGGDRAALEQLLLRYHDRVLRIVRVRISHSLRRHLESMDIVQETLRKAAANLDGLELRSTASILQWLSRIAENQMLDMHRRLTAAKRDKGREVPLLDSREAGELRRKPPPASGQLPPDELAATEELRVIVDECVAELPDDYREVIMLRTYCGGSWEFVAQQMKRDSPDAVRQLHRRARLRLARRLQQRMGGAEGL